MATASLLGEWPPKYQTCKTKSARAAATAGPVNHEGETDVIDTKTTPPAQTLVAADNPMWDELGPLVTPRKYSWGALRELGYETGRDRFNYCSKYAWTVTSPEVVAFVAEHVKDGVIDPLAGSGYWAYLLEQCGIDVLASDRDPAGGESPNQWHKGTAWLPIHRLDAVASVARAAKQRALLLSWPPYDEPIGRDVLSAYTGDRVVYIGEPDGGCCGSDAMFELLASDWNFMGEHEPVQWFGMHDYVRVFDRKAVSA